jgi:tetratricopeptide (TPR) repeat protein
MGTAMRLPFAAAFILLLSITSFAEPPKSGLQQDQDRRQAIDHYERGRDAMASERFEEAVTEFQAAIQLDPLLTLAYFRKGQAHMALKEYAQAEQSFVGCRQAYESLAGLQLSNSEDVERRRDQQIQMLENEIQLIQSGQLKGPGGSTATRNTQLEQQISDLKRNRRKGTQEVLAVPAELSVSLGSAYFRQGKMDLAEREWKTAAVANPKLGEAHNNLAALYLMTSKLDDAEKELDLAEKAGYHVHPRLKEDIKNARKAPN